MGKEVVYCTSQEEWEFVNSKLIIGNRLELKYWEERVSNGPTYKDGLCKHLHCGQYSSKIWYESEGYKIYSFEEWEKLTNNYLNKNKINIGMEETMLDVLNKTYDNLILRKRTVPLFMSNPGIGKSTIIRKFAEEKGVKMKKITLSQRMPNEVVGGLMPDKESKSWEVYDNHELLKLKDGDILFFDEVFNGTLKQTLDAVLNLLEDRVLPSGRKLANVMIVAASNPQGLINLTPQIKERFIRYDLKFVFSEYQALLKESYGMPESISAHLCTLINKEKFESNEWDFITPRSIEKAINQVGCDLKSPYGDMILPFLSQKLEAPEAIPLLGVKKGEEVEYLSILKLIIKDANQKESQKLEVKITDKVLN